MTPQERLEEFTRELNSEVSTSEMAKLLLARAWYYFVTTLRLRYLRWRYK